MSARRVGHFQALVLLLSEVQRFARVDFEADRLDEVLVRNLPVLVFVKEVENDVRLFISQREAPAVQKEDQLFLLDVLVVVLVEVFESLVDGAPLLANLVDKAVQNVAVRHQGDRCCAFVFTLQPLLRPHELLLDRVLLRVMAEDKTGQVVDFVAHPFAEVSIVQAACAVLVRAN